MDAEDVQWSELPEAIVAKIQAQLPMLSLLRSRAVCRNWRLAVSSPWLMQERLKSGAASRDCMLFVAGRVSEDSMTFCVYDHGSDRWYKLPAPGTPPAGLRDFWEEWIRDSENHIDPMMSAGGNVLMSTTNIQYIGNPVRGWWKPLPALPEGNMWDRDVLGVFVDATVRRFKIVALQRMQPNPARVRDGNFPTHVFDSETGRWEVTTSELPRTQFFDILADQGAFVGTVLYCLARLSFQRCNLLVYDLERASWSCMAVARPDFDTIFCLETNLVSLQERLLCLALGRDSIPLGTACDYVVQIWELDFARMAWTVLATMPAPMLAHVCEKCHFPGAAGVHRVTMLEYIKVVALPDCEVYMMHDDWDWVVAVDLGRTPAVWRWLPSCPYEPFVEKSLHCVDPWLKLSTS